MARLSVDELVNAVGGRLRAGAPGAAVEGAAIDSRAVAGGEVFFALPGSRTDGHRFVGDAFARGAAAAVVSEPEVAGEGGATIEVEDPFRALHDLARHVRGRVPEKLVGITGSVGKTTTKELLAAMLGTRYRVARTPGNFNNLYGFPLTLLNTPEGTEWLVAELGMSTAGELRELSLLARPEVALFTTVRPVHLEFFDGVRAIAEAKAELLAGLAPGGFAVANADDPEVARVARRHQEGGGRVVWYGTGREPDVRRTSLEPGPAGLGSRFRLEAGGPAGGVGTGHPGRAEAADFELPLHGLYNADNALAAAACAWAIGVPLADAARAVRDARPASMRGVVHRLANRVTVIDDSYNSNPHALGRALEGAAALPGERRVAILGDMLELGPEGPGFHREAGAEAARHGFSPVAGVGELSRELVEGARAAGAEAAWHTEAAAAADWAVAAVRPGDVVLVKASRGVHLDEVVRRLLAGGEAD